MTEKTYMATLVRGSTYVSQGIFYRKEKGAVEVTEKVKNYLEKTAFDEYAIPDGNGGNTIQHLPKFSFTEIKEEPKKKAKEEVSEPVAAEAEEKPSRSR